LHEADARNAMKRQSKRNEGFVHYARREKEKWRIYNAMSAERQ
jgi:phage pi2 protein 07